MSAVSAPLPWSITDCSSTDADSICIGTKGHAEKKGPNVQAASQAHWHRQILYFLLFVFNIIHTNSRLYEQISSEKSFYKTEQRGSPCSTHGCRQPVSYTSTSKAVGGGQHTQQYTDNRQDGTNRQSPGWYKQYTDNRQDGTNKQRSRQGHSHCP